MSPSNPPSRTIPGDLSKFPKAIASQEEDALVILRARFSPGSDVDGTHADDLYAVQDLPLPVGKTLCLRITSRQQRGREFIFTRGNIVIGRSEDADVTLSDSKVSRKHALIEAFSREEIFLTDLASKNGTFLNRMRIRSVKLKDGDTIRVGNTVMVFSAADAP